MSSQIQPQRSSIVMSEQEPSVSEVDKSETNEDLIPDNRCFRKMNTEFDVLE